MGIVLLSLGRKAYREFSVNMAVSVRHHSPTQPIQLITEQSHLDLMEDWELKLFDIITLMPDEICYTEYKGRRRLNPGYAKIRMYEFVEFDEYIYLDVDGLLLKPIEPLFRQDGDFKSILVGNGRSDEYKYDNMIWAWPRDIWNRYGLDKTKILPFLNSSFQYIKKGETCDKLFETARSLIENPIPLTLHRARWGNSQPDELYMNIALCLLDIDPSLEKLDDYPIYFERHNCRKDPEEDYYILGLYGDKTHTHKSVLMYYHRKTHDLFSLIGREPYNIKKMFNQKFMFNKGK